MQLNPARSNKSHQSPWNWYKRVAQSALHVVVFSCAFVVKHQKGRCTHKTSFRLDIVIYEQRHDLGKTRLCNMLPYNSFSN